MHVAVLDTDILVSFTTRMVMLWLADFRLYEPKWTTDIRAEFFRVMPREIDGMTQARATEIWGYINQGLPRPYIRGYRHIIDELPMEDDRDDRHVLAAAIHGGCDTIVTKNLRHFPQEILERYEINAQNHDQSLCDFIDVSPRRVCRALAEFRGSLRRLQPNTPERFLQMLHNQGFINSSQRLQDYRHLL